MRPERPWRVVASLAASSLAGVVGLLCWWQAVPGLWELATFTPTGPIPPMGLAGYLMLGVLGGLFIAQPLSLLACMLSERRAALKAAVLGMLAGALPMLNFVLFLVIVFVRGIELSP
jgi:hypothetical protein